MRRVLGQLLLVAVAWAFTGLAAEAAAHFPHAPKGAHISPKLASLIHYAHTLAHRLDYAPCYWVRETYTLESYHSVQRELKEALDNEKREDVRKYIDHVGDWLWESRENFYDDEFFFGCEWSYYREYGKTPVLPSTLYYIPNHYYQLTVNGYAGQLNRPDFSSALQLERVGQIVDNRFGFVKRKDDYQAFDINGEVSARWFWANKVIFGYHYGTATNQSSMGTLSAGNADLLLLSPQGPGGDLGGGVRVLNALGADVTNSHYADDYSEQLGYVGLKYNAWHYGVTGLTITPFTKLIVGYDRESSNYAGTTNNGGLDFEYINRIKTWRVGVELGAEFKQPLGDNYGLFANGAVRFIKNYGSADSTLRLNGAVNATESANASVDKFDTGYVVSGGFYAETGNSIISISAAAETWQIPGLLYSPTAPFTLDYGSRDTFSAMVSYTYKFGLTQNKAPATGVRR
jgi:hypothetical protein